MWKSSVENCTKFDSWMGEAKSKIILRLVVSFLFGKSPASMYYCMPTFRNSLSVPSSKAMVEHCSTIAIEDGTDREFRNVGMH